MRWNHADNQPRQEIVTLVFLLPLLFGIHGIESVQAAADILTFSISIPFHVYFFRKHLSLPDAED